MKQKQKTILSEDLSEEITCIDCGKTFELTDKEKEWYEKMDFQLPRRCKECRAERKKRNALYERVETASGYDL